MKGRNDQDGGFGYVVIEDILESIKEESVQVDPTKTLLPKTKVFLDHSFGSGIVEHFICCRSIVPDNGNISSDQDGFLEEIVIEIIWD